MDSYEHLRAQYDAMRAPDKAKDALHAALARKSYVMSEPHLSGHRVIIGFETLEDAQNALQAVAKIDKQERNNAD